MPKKYHRCYPTLNLSLKASHAIFCLILFGLFAFIHLFCFVLYFWLFFRRISVILLSDCLQILLLILNKFKKTILSSIPPEIQLTLESKFWGNPLNGMIKFLMLVSKNVWVASLNYDLTSWAVTLGYPIFFAK